MRAYVSMSTLDILRFAGSRGDNGWTYIITGRPGTTGKTYLRDLLKRNGYHAIEISEDIFDLVEYKGDKNYFLVNEEEKYAIIMRNKPWTATDEKKEQKYESIKRIYNGGHNG